METRCRDTRGRTPLVAFVDRPEPSGTGRNAGGETPGKAGIGYMMASATYNRSLERKPSGMQEGKLATQQAKTHDWRACPAQTPTLGQRSRAVGG
jgi:hypothetical protein